MKVEKNEFSSVTYRFLSAICCTEYRGGQSCDTKFGVLVGLRLRRFPTRLPSSDVLALFFGFLSLYLVNCEVFSYLFSDEIMKDIYLPWGLAGGRKSHQSMVVFELVILKPG